ncbi:P66 protein [Tripterygium wilfordii]|uniref:P66 protein n=1 Tax=Tripterygium wilfordii TaxID=458696 RepID=A0A7J7C1S2_TRIWF|nr:beta-glucosidase 24-like [Tripterygium wilfordii]KAF5728100.1 P66 protein [Tripterygium wilfordii]
MTIQSSVLLRLVALASFLALLAPSIADDSYSTFCDAPYFDSSNFTIFTDNFYWGSAIAAYQVEGEVFLGRGPSIWDNFTHTYPGRIADKSNGDVAADFYNSYEEDLKLVKDMNMNSFRFSFSWTRLLPNGKLRDGVSQEGVAFYNRLIDQMISYGLEPFATIFHWDTPQALDEEYGSFLSSNILSDFLDYAELCFQLFGDRVKKWITINEPYTYSVYAYNNGQFAPGRCSTWVNEACQVGNSSIEPYIVCHNLLLAHGAAVQLYREKYQEVQKGKIGITLSSFWYLPYTDNPLDSVAASTAVDFNIGWHLGPITSGQYPQSMIKNVGDRLPVFTAEESEMLIGSFDFLGLNYYSTYYASYNDTVGNVDYTTDQHLIVHFNDREGVPIGPLAPGSKWIYVYPAGIRHLLKHAKDVYNISLIYITENGISEQDDDSLTLEEALYDPWRKEYYRCHLWNVLKSMKEDDVNVEGYFTWSLMDNFEWQYGYTNRFGLIYIDFKNGLTRYPKDSVYWLTQFLKNANSSIKEVVPAEVTPR